jgi:hypothetical protein
LKEKWGRLKQKPTSLIAKKPTSLIAKISTFLIAKKPALLFTDYTCAVYLPERISEGK